MPAPTEATSAICRRARFVTPSAVSRKTAAAAASRPVMCQALTRSAGATAAASADAARNASQARTAGSRHDGKRPADTSATAHVPIANSRSASRFVTDCPGSRQIGVVTSNGASAASRNTPAAATRLGMMRSIEFQDPCHGRDAPAKRHAGCIPAARMGSASVATRAVGRESTHKLTEAENSFRNAKLRHLALIVYKTLADAASKGAFFVITVAAARRLTPWAFGVFALGTTLGWMLSVLTDFGMQMHVARAVASRPESARAVLRRWWRLRVLTSAAGLAVLTAVLFVARIERSLAIPVTLLAIVYVVTGLVE